MTTKPGASHPWRKTVARDRCDHRLVGVQCCRAGGHSMDGQYGGHRYKCAGPSCPGLGWIASNTPHPTQCSLPKP